MARREKPHLSKDDKALWDRVRKTTTPLRKKSPDLVVKQAAHPVPLADAAGDKPYKIEPFSIGDQAAIKTAAMGISQNRQPPLHMDHRTYQKISRGKLRPDARIDLHDLTAAQAHQALIAFIINAHAQKKRLVLVITGKGKARPDYGPIPERVGILRQFLPHWVSTPPLKPYIQSLRQAHQRDGGLGAFYVYLRK